jgi:hypothetical protein
MKNSTFHDWQQRIFDAIQTQKLRRSKEKHWVILLIMANQVFKMST